ncbi:hypothetical protein [Erythrobacter crassostreae]|uniref:Uncharacterized protein n=1 Tax=Erythrobacter crassostreae TaxID=2828328 RepID=A0A9X1F4J6_9SPHN|nr:hypothetical protein [Erythrobacter crassostrea]MBV7259203.1 hypothetical protein [Erythrobacter crassostrea]
MLVLVLAVWAGGRAMSWENPFPAIKDLTGSDSFLAKNDASDGQSEEANSSAYTPDALSSSQQLTRPLTQETAPFFAVLGTATAAPRDWLKPRQAFGHQTLWAQAMSTRLSYRQEAAYTRQRPMRISGVTPLSPPLDDAKPLGRWSFDTWGFWRQGSGSTAISQGRVPIYGASQIGANLQYRIAPSSSHDPRLYARAYRALVTNGETEFAVGASARPIGSLPIRFAAEWRVTERLSGAELRPAVLATTELPPQKLPANFRLEAYGGAGYVGGDGATAFVDGQAAVTRELVKFEGPSDTGARLSVGAGAWGGAQNDASRVDVGPTMRLDLTLGEVPARLSVDWRERVGGDASPDSGIAATLSTRF